MSAKIKTVLITGGSGSWGHRLTVELLKNRNFRIFIFSRNEYLQVMMKRRFNNSERLSFIIGDVRDFNRVNEVILRNKIDYIFHLAALKHVPVCETQPIEALKTNIDGTTNVIRAALNNRVEKCVFVSTDKACEPLNLYGNTKAIAEKVMREANKWGNTKFIVIRAGNVLGSNGSVVPFFVEFSKNKRPLLLTDDRMTRYLMSLDEAIKLLLAAFRKGVGGEIFVYNMKGVRLIDLADVIWKWYNPDQDLKIKKMGLRAGEKIHECLVSENEIEFTKDIGDFKVILPMDHSLDKYYAEFPNLSIRKYTSNDILMTKEEIRTLLVREGYLK